ncbi:hypothetical protein PMAYCL1PPCAC_20295, partial [Pristionchus mayeri]
ILVHLLNSISIHVSLFNGVLVQVFQLHVMHWKHCFINALWTTANMFAEVTSVQTAIMAIIIGLFLGIIFSEMSQPLFEIVHAMQKNDKFSDVAVIPVMFSMMIFFHLSIMDPEGILMPPTPSNRSENEGNAQPPVDQQTPKITHQIHPIDTKISLRLFSMLASVLGMISYVCYVCYQFQQDPPRDVGELLRWLIIPAFLSLIFMNCLNAISEFLIPYNECLRDIAWR